MTLRSIGLITSILLVALMMVSGLWYGHLVSADIWVHRVFGGPKGILDDNPL